MNNKRGFTLIEILVATAVSMIMLIAIGMAITSAQRSTGGVERKVTAQQDVRSALELMAMEIRMASYNPAFAVGIWRSDGNPGGIGFCSAASANQTFLGIQEATASSITVEMDIAGGVDRSGFPDGEGTLTQSNEIIRYNYVPTNPQQYITRETNCGGAQPFLGNAVGNPRTVRVINDDLGIPIFRYFNGQGNAIPVDGTANGIPAQSPNIRMIEITLAVETDEINPDTGQTRKMIYSTREILRNH